MACSACEKWCTALFLAEAAVQALKKHFSHAGSVNVSPDTVQSCIRSGPSAGGRGWQTRFGHEQAFVWFSFGQAAAECHARIVM